LFLTIHSQGFYSSGLWGRVPSTSWWAQVGPGECWDGDCITVSILLFLHCCMHVPAHVILTAVMPFRMEILQLLTKNLISAILFARSIIPCTTVFAPLNEKLPHVVIL
jgi:hypothetical protein